MGITKAHFILKIRLVRPCIQALTPKYMYKPVSRVACEGRYQAECVASVYVLVAILITMSCSYEIFSTYGAGAVWLNYTQSN